MHAPQAVEGVLRLGNLIGASSYGRFVPEPSFALLWAPGVVAFGLLRRRKNTLVAYSPSPRLTGRRCMKRCRAFLNPAPIAGVGFQGMPAAINNTSVTYKQ